MIKFCHLSFFRQQIQVKYLIIYLVIEMKKTIIWIIFALVSGALLGKFTFDRYEKIDTRNVISYDNYVYMLKYGTYESEDEMGNKVTDVDRYVFIATDNKVTAYVGISKTKESLSKVKNIYDKKNVDLTIEKVKIDNDEFIQNLNEYEKLLVATDDEKSLLIIEKQILSCYESVVVNNE